MAAAAAGHRIASPTKSGRHLVVLLVGLWAVLAADGRHHWDEPIYLYMAAYFDPSSILDHRPVRLQVLRVADSAPSLLQPDFLPDRSRTARHRGHRGHLQRARRDRAAAGAADGAAVHRRRPWAGPRHRPHALRAHGIVARWDDDARSSRPLHHDGGALLLRACAGTRAPFSLAPVGAVRRCRGRRWRW